MLKSLSASGFVCFDIVAQNVTNPYAGHEIPYDSTALPASETAPSLTL